jgi:uncharacterized DUF497 family protein
MGLVFEWDEGKARENARKHGITFEESMTVFGDPFSLTTHDPMHSRSEDRFVTMGESIRRRILVVIHTEREERIRIISSRKATSLERQTYEEKNK